MTARATFTEAEITRAINAAKKTGKVAIMTPSGIIFADPDTVQTKPTADPFDLVDLAR